MYKKKSFVHTKNGDVMHIECLLKQIRTQKGISLEKLSRMSGVSSTHLNDIENNKKEAGTTILFKIAKALNMKIEDLYKVYW